MSRGQARDRLLAAAVDLFAARGFDRTTTRDLAEQAGVDASLIARYFGSKAGLYLAALRVELGEQSPPDLQQPGRMRDLLERLDQRGPGPVVQAAVRRHEDPTVEGAARDALQERLVGPLRERWEHEGVDRAQLRAELTVAAYVGVVLGRGSGAFPALAQVGVDELADLLGEAVATLRTARAAVGSAPTA